MPTVPHVQANPRDRFDTLESLYQAEDDDEGWRAWCSMVEARNAGAKLGRFPDDLLPEEVRRRRAAAQQTTRWLPPARSSSKGGKR